MVIFSDIENYPMDIPMDKFWNFSKANNYLSEGLT